MITPQNAEFLIALQRVKDDYASLNTASLIAQINAFKTLIKAYTPDSHLNLVPEIGNDAMSNLNKLLRHREQLLKRVLQSLVLMAENDGVCEG